MHSFDIGNQQGIYFQKEYDFFTSQKHSMFHMQLIHWMRCKGLIKASTVETCVDYVLTSKGHYNWLKVQLYRCVYQPTSIKIIDSVLVLHSSLGYLSKTNMHGAQPNVDCEKIHIGYHIQESPYCNLRVLENLQTFECKI